MRDAALGAVPNAFPATRAAMQALTQIWSPRRDKQRWRRSDNVCNSWNTRRNCWRKHCSLCAAVLLNCFPAGH